MASPKNEENEAHSPESRFQFESQVLSNYNANNQLEDDNQNLSRIPIPVSNFRRLVEQNDCHSFITKDPQYLTGLVDQKRRTIAQEFLESASSPSFWVCNIKQAYTTLKYSTNLRCVQHDVAAGTYDVIWSFAYIYRSGQFTPFHHKEFVLIAGNPVNESQFMGRTTDPEQEYGGNINMVIYREGRAATRFKIPVVTEEKWRFPVKEGYLGQSFKVVAHELEVTEKSSVGFFIRKIAGGVGDGQVYFLGCELVQTKGGKEEEDSADDGPILDSQQDLPSIDKCIAKYQADLSLRTEAAQVSTHQLLAKAYFDRYRASGDDYFSCCESSITQYQAALEHYKKDPQLSNHSSGNMQTCLLELGDVFMERLLRRRFDREESARKAEECFRSVLKVEPSNFTAVAKLVFILNILYELSHSQSLLDEALQLGEEGLVQVTEEDKSFQFLLEASAITLLNRSELLGSTDELDTATELLRVGLNLPTQVREPWRLQQLLAEVLRRRFEVTGNREDIREARRFIEEASSAKNLLVREQIKRCLTYASILYTQYLFNRDQELLRRVRNIYLEGVKLWPLNQDTPEFGYILMGYGLAVQESYSRAGEDSEFNGYSITQLGCVHGAGSIQNTTTDATMIKYMFEYGKAEANRYWLDGTKKQLENARAYLNRCFEISFTHSDTNFSSHACAMSWVLREQYSLSGKTEHLEMARRCLRKVFIRPWPITAHVKAHLAAEIGHHLWILFETTGESLYLDQTINIRQKAVEFTSTDFSRHIEHILDLARALLEKSIRSQRLEDFKLVNNKLDLARKLVDQKKDRWWSIREVRARLREEQWKCSNDKLFLERAIQLYVEIYTISYSRPQKKIGAAVHASLLRMSKNDKKGAAESLEAAEKILIEFVISEGYSRNDQLEIIRRWNNLPISVAFYRLVAGDSVGKVLQSLEMSRSILWNRTLNRRVETELLQNKHPDLFEKFQELKLQLSPDDSDKRQKALKDSGIFSESTGLRNKGHLKLAQKYAEVLELIRRQTGFENFLLPLPDQERIQRLANQGPIVMIIHSGNSSSVCLALIIKETEITSLTLPNFGDQDCAAQFQKFKEALALQELDSQRASQTLEEVLKWMWTAAAEPILEHLGYTSTSTAARESKGERLPRIWWVTSGWVNILPIHAAGDHTRELVEGEKCSVIDRVISSYTPTLSALEYTRLCMEKMTSSQVSSSPTETPTALLVAMPKTDSLPTLPNTHTEVEAVGQTITPYVNLSKFEGSQATKTKIDQALRHCSIAHFACHGKINPKNPINSRLCLQDHRRMPLTVGVLMAMDINNCQLAYLSACESAVNKDMRLKEEGLHLSGALQMAGVPNTVATWWEISDAVSVTVAKEFYEGLVGKGILNVGMAGEALHAVTLRLRNGYLKERRRGEEFSALIWGAYVHFGP